MFSPEQIFWCTILTNRVKPLKYNYSSTLVIQGLLEAITAMMPSQMFQTSLKKINLKTTKKYNKNAVILQYSCFSSYLCVLECFFFNYYYYYVSCTMAVMSSDVVGVTALQPKLCVSPHLSVLGRLAATLSPSNWWKKCKLYHRHFIATSLMP